MCVCAPSVSTPTSGEIPWRSGSAKEEALACPALSFQSCKEWTTYWVYDPLKRCMQAHQNRVNEEGIHSGIGISQGKDPSPGRLAMPSHAMTFSYHLHFLSLVLPLSSNYSNYAQGQRLGPGASHSHFVRPIRPCHAICGKLCGK